MKKKCQQNYLVAFLVTVILVDFMGMATVVVLFPNLLLSTESMFTAAWSHNSKLIMMGLFLAIYPLGQVFGASILGKLSDYYGRKKLLIVTLIGTLIGFFLSGISIVIGSTIILFISRLLAGLCAGNVAIAQASLLDISTSDTKVKNIGYSQMAMGSAYIVGPILGGWLSQSSVVSWFDMSTPFWFFTLVIMVLIIVTVCFYSETLVAPKKGKINVFESVQQIAKALTSKKLGRVFSIWLLFVCGWWLFESFMPAYLLQNFHYDTVKIGNLLAFNGALYAGFQYVVVQRIAKHISPRNMMSFSAVIAGLAIVGIAFVSSTIQLYTCMSLFVMAMGFSIPGLITYISNLSDASDQGQVMGMLNSIQAVSTVVVMLIGGYLNSINGNITVIGGGVLIIFSWLFFLLTFHNKKYNTLSLQPN